MIDKVADDAGTVVTLATMEGGMRFRALGEVRAYWEALRKGRRVPARADVDPRGIESALEYAFIAERIAPGMARFRLAGMHLNDLIGMEVRGMPLSSFFAPEARHRIGEIIEEVFQGPSAAELVLSGETGIGKPPLAARLLLLPLRSDLGDVTRILGCLVSDGQIGRNPRRFLIDAVHVAAITAGYPTEFGAAAPSGPQADEIAPETATAPQPGFAEPAARFALPSKSPEERRAQLRLVVKND
ncbi:PAS domain-containing protein [Phaeovulum sp.]|uniref:PAS domain-containing protein n=1 Tax=Phaeovulum sp. TaxID=2934796 RepID=UPI003564C5C9